VIASREKGGVVDERLMVHGVRGLRVVNTSVFIVVPRGNTNTGVYTTVEKSADRLWRIGWQGRGHREEECDR